MRSAVADPRCQAAVQMERGTILGVRLGNTAKHRGRAARIRLQRHSEARRSRRGANHRVDAELAVIGGRRKAAHSDQLPGRGDVTIGHDHRRDFDLMERRRGNVRRGDKIGHHGHGHDRPGPSAHERGVGRQEEVAARARRQVVVEQDAHRHVFRGHDRCAQVLGRIDGEDLGSGRVEDRRTTGIRQGHVVADRGVRRRLDLHVAPQRGRIQGRTQLLGILDQRDLVVVRPGVGRLVRNRDRHVLPEVVRGRRRQARQRVHELLNAAGDCRAGDGRLRAIGPVGRSAVIVRRSALQGSHRKNGQKHTVLERLESQGAGSPRLGDVAFRTAASEESLEHGKSPEYELRGGGRKHALRATCSAHVRPTGITITHAVRRLKSSRVVEPHTENHVALRKDSHYPVRTMICCLCGGNVPWTRCEMFGPKEFRPKRRTVARSGGATAYRQCQNQSQ